MKLSKEAIHRIETQLAILKKNKDRLIIDADTHISDIENMHSEYKKTLSSTDHYYHGKPVSCEQLIDEMDMAGVNMSLSWQNPATTMYSNDPVKNFNALLESNRYIYNCSVKYPDRIIPAGWTDPSALSLDLAIKLIEICVKDFGFAIVKLNPAQNAFPIDSDVVKIVVNKIIEAGAIPAFHFGADTEYTPASGLKNISKSIYPNPLIAVHMGGGGSAYVDAEELYHEARELGLKQENIKYVLSAKRDTHMENDLITYTLAKGLAQKNLFCASDAPYGRMTWNFGGFREMFKSLMQGEAHTDSRLQENPSAFTEEIVQGFLGSNFAEFVIELYESILSKASKVTIN